jgi:hypothetical protein
MMVSRWTFSPRTSTIRIGALELAQQAVASLDGSIERGLRGFLAAETNSSFFSFTSSPVCQPGGAMLSGEKPVGRPSMLFMFFRRQYFLRSSMLRVAQ